MTEAPVDICLDALRDELFHQIANEGGGLIVKDGELHVHINGRVNLRRVVQVVLKAVP